MSLRLWLPLNGTLENKGSDTVTITNNNTTIDSSGKIGQCYSFNNSDSMIKIEGDLVSSMKSKTSFTISFWLYSNDSGNRSIYFATNTGTANVFGFALEKTTGELLRFYWQGSPDLNLSAFTIPNQEWVHITCVYKNDNVYLYKNGVLTASKTDGSIKISALTNTWSYASLGRDYRTGSTTLNGKLNDFRWYDNALSETEIKEIAKGLVLHLPLNNNGLGNKNILFNTNDLTLWNKESGVTINWDSDQQMYKMVVDKTNNTSRWGIYQNFTVTPNTTYTLSVEGLKGDHTTSMAVGTAESSIGWPANRYTFKTIKTKCVYTFTSGASDTVGRIYLNLQPTPDTGNKTAWFLHPKLELGDKATPWSPNPADENYPASGSGIPENLFVATDMSESITTNASTDWTKHFRIYNGSAAIHTIDTIEMTDTIALTTANSNLGIAFARLNSEINLDPTQYYTISCEAKCTNVNLKLCIGLSYYNDQSTWVWRGGSNAKTFTTANTWQKITHTFKPDANTYAICYCFTINPGASPTGTDTFSIRKCKLEKGSTATEWQPSPADDSYKTLGYYNNITFDQSGYNHNAVKYGDIHTYTSDAIKYNVSTHFSNKNQYIKISGLTTTGFGNSYSIAWWGKIDNLNYMQWGFMDGIRVNGMYTGRLWNTGDSSNNPLYVPGTTTQVTAPTANVWHHYVMIGNGTKCYVYVDG